MAPLMDPGAPRGTTAPGDTAAAMPSRVPVGGRLWKRVVAYTDGACEGNPGLGGWAAILQYEHRRKEVAGGELATTNNRMELSAAIEALACLKEACAVDLYTDSQYLRQGIGGWIRGWNKRDWKTVAGTPVKNADLWKRLDELNARHHVTWHWVRGHAGHTMNERCDALAKKEIARLRESHTAQEHAAALSKFRRSRPGAEGSL